MGEWAHPDDDTSIIGPCGVWHQKFGTRCGIIMVTRGEGGGNAAGTEQGPALGLRRENEDRVAHYRSGTVDIFNLDRVDFFYNQSAPLTQAIWNHTETLRRIVRIIRTTQPNIYIGFTPTLDAGHGNHQEAGRFIWEGMQAAANPHMFPGQLKGPHALATWQVKKIFSGGDSDGTGGTTKRANCTRGFRPEALDNVAGVWEGYPSPYKWPAGNLQGRTAGSAKNWAQVAAEGGAAYPTQSRVMYQGVASLACPRFAMTDNFVPFQPNRNPNGSLNKLAGNDGAILDGAVRRDPGGPPLGTLEYLTFSRFYNAPGTPFTVTLHARSGKGTLPAGRVTLHLPRGWKADRLARPIGAVTTAKATSVKFTVTPPAKAKVETEYRISADWRTGQARGYTDQVVDVVPPAEGRFQRFGNWAEYDRWLKRTAPEASRLGRSDAIQSVGAGETLDLPVVVHNWSKQPESGTVSLTLPTGMTADAATQPYAKLAPGKSTTVHFSVSNSFTDSTLPSGQLVSIPITTSYDKPARGSGAETLSLTIVPTTAIPTVATAPTLDGQPDAAYDSAPRLDIGRVWQGSSLCTGASDCGRSDTGDTDTDFAKVVQNGDALYFFAHIRDDYQSFAVTPAECFAHWEADSVEFQIDPQGNSSQRLTDTASTFKLGVFPFTDDPSNANGNGVNGPCWERDADNHQGFSTGPLASTVNDAPNAPGVQVASSAKWVGSDDTSVDHAYAGGGYNLEVKVPLADLPSKIDPAHFGLNITPYDNDDTAAPGTTTLRHIDMSARLGWSALNSIQSDPYRWGHASLPGYTPSATVAALPAVAPPAILSHSNLDGVDSPETIAQSARDGVTISGRPAAPANDELSTVKASPSAGGATIRYTATGAGTAHVFVWNGDVHAIPLWTTSCSPAADPGKDFGLTPCAQSDGGIPPWGTNMSGHVLGSQAVTVAKGTHTVTVTLDAVAQSALRKGGRALVSFETAKGAVQALDERLAAQPGG
jgi:LmbE family N-acetylglucosaminyl deacetylase